MINIKKPKYSCVLRENGVITSLIADEQPGNLIPENNGWGCEIGNWEDFFSQLKHLLPEQVISTSNNDIYKFDFEVTLKPSTRIAVTEHLEFREDKISQSFAFKIISLSGNLGDLVGRIVLRGDIFPQLIIGQASLNHKSNNIYHDFLPQVSIATTSQPKITITQQIEQPGAYQNIFDQTMYLRDEPPIANQQPAWVNHLRLIANSNHATQYYLRWFYPNMLIPQGISNWVGKQSYLRNMLWRAKEFRPCSPIQIGGSAHVQKDDTFMLSSTINFN